MPNQNPSWWRFSLEATKADLSPRALLHIRQVNERRPGSITCFGDVLGRTDAELLKLPFMSRATLAELRRVIG